MARWLERLEVVIYVCTWGFPSTAFAALDAQALLCPIDFSVDAHMYAGEDA